MEIPYWPHRYRHKIIGKAGPGFEESVHGLESRFPNMRREAASASKNGTYLSVTFELMADDVDEIIELWVQSEAVTDCVKIL
jgi:putative lipoic acid-binding regulatory protein